MMDEDLADYKVDCARHGYTLTDKCLGTGSFGKVLLAYATAAKRSLCTNQQKKVAVKIVSMDGKKNKDREILQLNEEIEILKSVQGSGNVIQLYETFECENNLYIIMEYASKGDLMDFIQEGFRGYQMTEENIRSMFQQLAEGLKHCHDNNVIHKDLKPNNILVSDDGTLKLGDFGIAQKLNESNETPRYGGTPRYMSPEMYERSFKKEETFDGRRNDIWGLGFILFFMLFGRHPGKGKQGERKSKMGIEDAIRMKSIIASERPSLSQGCIDLLCKMLAFDWRKRPDIDDIINDPWIKEGKNTKKRKRDLEDDEIAPEMKLFKHDYGMMETPLLVNPKQEVNQYAFNKYGHDQIGSNDSRSKERSVALEEKPAVPVVNKMIISFGGTSTSFTSSE